MSSPFTQEASPRTIRIISTVTVMVFMPLLILAVYQSVQLVSKAFGKKADIAIDVSRKGQAVSMDFVRAFAQGGEEATDMIAPVTAEVKGLAPRTIRVDHIYDYYDVVHRNGGGLSYSFGKLDAVIRTIRSTGAMPMIVLSYMPPAIAKDGKVINPPNNWDEWAMVVKATVEHYSGRSGMNLNGVMYEVWNEPDLESFGKWSIPNYLTLYRYAVNGASQAQNVNSFMIGGPVTTGLYKNWINALAESKMRVDFFSWHSYLPDPTTFKTQTQQFNEFVKDDPGYKDKPYIISEFGFTGAKSGGYSTSYASAHAAASIRQLIDDPPKYVYTFQLKDGPNETADSGWGLIRHESKGKTLKPRYNLFGVLSRMTGTRVSVTGEGDWVTGFATFRDGTLRLMLSNFDENGKNTQAVPVTVKNLPAGPYVYREYRPGQATVTKRIVIDGAKTAAGIDSTVTMLPNTVVVAEWDKQ